MIIFLIYAIVLAVFWMKNLLSNLDSDSDDKIKRFLQFKYLKLHYYKQYALLYIVSLFYIVVISMISAKFMSPADFKMPDGWLAQINHAVHVMLKYPVWLQILFYIGFILILFTYIYPIVRFLKHKKIQQLIDSIN